MTIRDIAIAFGYKIDENSEKKVEQGIQSLKQKATKLLGAVGVTLSIAGIATGIKDCVALASEVEEMENKFNVVFQGINDEVDAWAQNFADAIGRNKNDIKTYLADQQNLLVGFGMSREAGAELSEQMTSLALDLASFGNLDETSAVNAMTKAVMGESEAAKTIGAVLNDATRAEAMHALGLSGTYEKLDQLTKMQVNYQAILSQSSDAVGDCKRSLGSYQSTLKQFQAKLKEIKQMVGQFFMPTFQKVLSFGTRGLTRLRDWIQRLGSFINKLGGVERILKVLGAAVAATVVAMNAGKIVNFVKSIGKMASNFNLAKLKVLGFLAIFIVLALLIEDFLAFMRGDNSVIGALFEKAGIDADAARKTIINAWNTVKRFLGNVWGFIKGLAQEIFGSLSAWWAENGEEVKASFSKMWEGIKTLCITLWNALKGAATKIFGALKAFWDKWGGTITAAFKNIWHTLISLIQPFLDAIAAVIDFLANVFTGNWKGAWQAIKDFAAAIWQAIVAVISGAWEHIKIVWSVVKEFFQGVWDGIVSVFSGVVEWFAGIFSGAWEAIKGVFATVGEFFKGVWDTIVGLFTSIGTAVSDAISGAVKGAINAVLSGAIGIINGFISAINAAISVINAIPGVEIKKITKLEVPQLAEGGYVEPNKPRPVIVGDNKQEGEIISPISKMKDTVLSALRTFVSGASSLTKARAVSGDSAALAVGGSTSNKTINQNVNISNQFNGDRAGQQKSSEAMDKAAEDSTSQMARALALIRT